jgi:hypothetical protein
MKLRSAIQTLTIALSAALLAACDSGSGTTTVTQSAPVISSSGGPTIVDNPIEKEPVIQAPGPQETLYKVRVIDRASQKPIGLARVVVLYNQPEPLFMREPLRRDVIVDTKTRSHGLVYTMAKADGAMKYALVTGKGFIPTVVEAGPAVGGATQETRIEVDIVPVCSFIIKSPNGDRADEALCTMKPDEDSVSNRPGLKANYGWSERADALGVVTFNRQPGVYRLEFSDRDGKHRWYEKFTWDAKPQTTSREITLPETSQEKPW